MAHEAAGSEATSVASATSPSPNWWENIHTIPFSSWNSMNVNNRWQQPHSNISSNNCEDGDHMSNISTTTSFVTNTSNRSMDSSSAELSGEPSENNLWNQVLLNNDRIDNGENFLEVLSSKTLNPTEMYHPACDYLKKLDCTNWGIPNQSPSLLNTIGINTKQQINNFNNPADLIEPEQLTNLSDMVSTWSIAPPNPNMSPVKNEMFPNSASYLPSYEPNGPSRAYNINNVANNGMGCQLMGLNNSLIGLNSNKYCSGPTISDAPWSNNARSLSDLISFKGSRLSTSHSKRQVYETSSSLQTKGSGRASGTTSDGKKKRSDDNSEAQFKKSKHNDQSSNAASSVKLQAPKVKLSEKITALQQIVSPFGKTDTASVLLEAINYIGILQEQVQLLSDPYLKTSPNKGMINSWGSGSNLERKDKGETKIVDLRSRGLCLVPISCTPQIYRENSGPDYWPPTYRSGSCLFR